MNAWNNELDPIDRKILDMMKYNCRIQWREIGEVLHISGQAVGERVKRLNKSGVIEGYTIKINPYYKAKTRIDYITVIMKNNQHDNFIEFVKNTQWVVEAHRISGHGCYILKVVTPGQEELNSILNEVLKYSNYQLNSSVQVIKA